MSAVAAHTYAVLLESARIAALEALTDILKTSDDPAERRHAATAILRAPEPDAPAPPAPEPAQQPAPALLQAPTTQHPRRTPATPKLSAVEELLALSRAAHGDLALSDTDEPMEPPESSEHPPAAPFIPAATTPAAKLRAAAGATG